MGLEEKGSVSKGTTQRCGLTGKIEARRRVSRQLTGASTIIMIESASCDATASGLCSSPPEEKSARYTRDSWTQDPMILDVLLARDEVLWWVASRHHATVTRENNAKMGGS